MSPQEEVIDLCGSSDGEDAPAERAPKRPRLAAWADEVQLVEEEELRQQQQQQQQPQRQEFVDDDLAILEAHGDVWNKNLPHTRDLCGEKPFSKDRASSNAAHCSKCYCYVCDCPVDECTNWGTGNTRWDHCHAHVGDVYFATLKRGRRAAAAAAAPQAQAPGGSGGSGSADAALARRASAAERVMRAFPGGMHMMDAYERALGRGAKIRISPAKPRAKPQVQPCRMKRIADPSQDPDLMLLARVEVGVKAQGTHTIAGLREKLEPTGFYLALDNMPQYGDKLCMDNLFENHWDHGSGKYVPLRLELCQMPLAEQQPQTTDMRARKVTIMHYDGRAPPTTYGVSVHKEATLKEVMQAAAPLAGLDARREQFLATNTATTAGLSVAFMSETTKITDRDHRNFNIALWRVPKPAPGEKESAPNYAVIFHRRRTTTEYPAWEAVGLPTLLPLGKAFATGGKAAEKAMVERMLEVLAPLRRLPEGTAAQLPAQEAKALLAAGLKLLRTSPYGAGYAPEHDTEAEFSRTRQLESGMRYGESFFRDGKMYLRVDWTPERLVTFDTHAWLHPAVDASASPEALQPTMDIIKAVDEWEAKVRHAKQLPANMLEALKAAARCCEPGVVYPPHRLYTADPLARVVLNLAPASAEAGEKDGKAVFEVYVWKAERGLSHRAFFQPYDTWDSARSSRREWRELGSHPLKALMDVMLWSNPQHKRMVDSIKEWADKEAAAPRSIPGLMQVLEREEMPAAEQPAGLNVTMRPYQRQSLQFMLDCEKGEGGFRRLFWERLVTPGGTPYWWSSLLGRASMDVPAQGWGGWCCEEMGLGKTIEVLGLILANPAPPLPRGVQKDDKGLIKSRATLVVCAVSLVGQWIAEAQAKLAHRSLRIHMYHGQQRIRDPVRLATEFDLVVTTYATLGADFGGKRNGGSRPNFPPLGAIKWHRLVLDEAHTVKNAAVAHTKACMALQADRRWMCTGTPINTDVSDLFGQFAVLGLAPFNNKTMFDGHVKSAYGNGIGNGCVPLLYTLGQVMVRHTKRQVLGGEEVLRLPPKTEETVEVVLTAEEQEMYKKAHAASAALFAQYRQMGNATINKHLLQIMALLLPMRRVCSGGNLRSSDLTVNDPLFGEGAGVRQRRLSGAALVPDHSLVAPEQDCPICFDMPENPSMTPCEHWFCRECILGWLVAHQGCPLCRRNLTLDELRQGITAGEADAEEAAAEAAAAAAAGAGGCGAGAGEGEEGAAQAAAAAAQATFVSESKLQALLKELRAMRRADPTAKALIFSQYVSTIEWLKTRLTAAGFGYRFISGSMPLKQRAKAINAFQGDPPTTVFLLSMRSGSVGINLTAASHVFLMEPALNPALEEQAIGRAWRMGQQRNVKVLKFYVKGSVEERIMEVVKKRTEAVAGGGARGEAGAGAGTTSDDDEDDYGMHGHGAGFGRGGRGRGARTNVRMQDLVGSINADRQQLRVDELEILFKDPVFPEPRVPEEEETDDEEEAAAAIAAAQAAAANRNPGTGGAAVQQQQQRGSGGGAGRGRKKRSRAAMASDEEEEESGPALGRGGRRATRRLPARSYAALFAADDEEEEEEEEEEGSGAARLGRTLRKKRGRSAGDSEDEEFVPEGDDASPNSYKEESEDEESEEEEEEGMRGGAGWGGRGGRGPKPRRLVKRPIRFAQRQQQQQQQGVPVSRIKQVTTTTRTWGAGAAGQQQQQQNSASQGQQQQQQQDGPPSRPGSGTNRLSTGWAARPFSAGAAAAGAAAPSAAGAGAAAAAGAGAPPGAHSTPRNVRMPMRGARLPAALTAHLAAAGSAGRGAAPGSAQQQQEQQHD